MHGYYNRSKRENSRNALGKNRMEDLNRIGAGQEMYRINGVLILAACQCENLKQKIPQHAN